MSDRVFSPRLNHVAISVDPAVLDADGRTTVLDFYGEVFGWTEEDNTGESGNPLILYTGAPAQFVGGQCPRVIEGESSGRGHRQRQASSAAKALSMGRIRPSHRGHSV